MPWFKSAPPPLERETLVITLDDGREISLLRVRDGRAKRLRLSVSERGVRLTLPRAVSLRVADAFVRQQHDWLSMQLARFAAVSAPMPLLRGISNILPLRGESLPLRWCEGRYPRLELGEHEALLHLPAQAGDSRARATLREFYLSQAQADVGRWLPRYLPELPTVPTRIRLRPLSSLWGSLSASNVLSLDLALVLGPPAAFEYVLVHELCHLIERNHSPSFWREVERRCPDWRQHRSWFRTHGLGLKTQLRALLDG